VRVLDDVVAEHRESAFVRLDQRRDTTDEGRLSCSVRTKNCEDPFLVGNEVLPMSTLLREWIELELTALEHDQPISRADALRALAALRPLGAA
jgi:hypothetical protein